MTLQTKSHTDYRIEFIQRHLFGTYKYQVINHMHTDQPNLQLLCSKQSHILLHVHYSSRYPGGGDQEEGCLEPPPPPPMRQNYFIFIENFQKNQEKLTNNQVKLPNKTTYTIDPGSTPDIRFNLYPKLHRFSLIQIDLVSLRILHLELGEKIAIKNGSQIWE